jgi:hypothetical protein
MAAAVVAAVCLCYLVSQNLSSRNIAIGTGALAGAAILHFIQLYFELRAEEDTDFITAEYTIDRGRPEIRQWNCSSNMGLRMSLELGASRNFAEGNPGQFNGNREKLTHDMVLFSLLAYFGVKEFDWQMKRTQLVGRNTGTNTTTVPGSKADECTAITRDQLRRMLLNAGNSFADVDMFFGRQSLCLPPRSAFYVNADELTVINPFCEISFILESSGAIFLDAPVQTHLSSPTSLTENKHSRQDLPAFE